MRFEKVSLEQFTKDVLELYPDTNIEKIKEAWEELELPKRATKGSAGYDFHIPFSMKFYVDMDKVVPTGIKAYVDPGYVLMIFPRSGLGFKYGIHLMNTVGVIDEDYVNAENEGHIMIALKNGDVKSLMLEQGDRFAQGVFLPYGTVDNDKTKTKRTGGMGSTGE